MVIIFEIIVVAMLVIIINFSTYYFIRYLDKKERKKIEIRENIRINELINKMQIVNELKRAEAEDMALKMLASDNKND